MATERLEIIVSENGSRTVKRNIEDVGKAGRQAGEGTDLLKRALGGLAAAGALAFLRQTVDTYSQMISRLRLVTTSTTNLTAVNDRLFLSANRTRSSYEETVQLYAKLAQGAKALGVGQEDLLGITETVNQAIQVSGASATEAAGGLRQLGQAIASGSLRGDELNSILENMPRLAQAIADGMGITVGQLRAVGAEGKITAGEIISALKDQAPVIAAEFAQVTPTISSAFQVLMNNATRFIGELDQATGASRTFAQLILLVANNMDVLVAVIGTVGVALLAVYGPSLVGMLGTATGAVRAFTLALMSNPLGLLAVALAAATTAVIAFGDRFQVVADDLSTTKNEAVSFKDVFLESFSTIASEAYTAANANTTAWDESLTSSGEKSSEFRDMVVRNVMQMVDDTKREANFIIGLFVGTYRAIVVTWSELPRAFKDIGITAVNGLIEALEGGINRAATLIAAGPFAPFINGGAGLQLINIPRLENDAQNAARVVLGTFGNIVGEALGVDYIGNGINRAITNVQNRNNTPGGQLNPGGPSTVLPTTDKDAAKAAKDAADAADILRRFNQETADNIRLTQEDVSARRVLSDIMGLESQLREKNASLTGDQRAAVEASLTSMYEQQDIAQRRDALLEQLSGREDAYRQGLEALSQVIDRNAISQARYDQEVLKLDYARLQGELDGYTGGLRGLLQVQMELADEGSRVEQAVIGIWGQARGPLLDYRADLQAVVALYNEMRLSAPEALLAVDQATIRYLGTLRDVESGARRAFLAIGMDMQDAAANIERVITNAFRAAEDALTQFITTGKADIKGFIGGIAEDLTRSFVRENILGPLASSLGLSGSAVGIPLGEAGNPMHVVQDQGASGVLDPRTWWEQAQEGGTSFFDRLRTGFDEMRATGGNVFSQIGNFIKNLISGSSGGSGKGIFGTILSLAGSYFGGWGGGPPSDLTGLYATGGSFRVGGSGGVDSQLVKFRASPGEDVSITRAGQKGSGEGGGDFYSLTVDARGANDEAAVEAAVERGIRAAEPIFLARARKAAAKDVQNTFGRQKL